MAPTPVAAGNAARTGSAKPPPQPSVKVTVSHQAPSSARALAGAAAALGKGAAKAAAGGGQKPAGQPATFNPLTSGPGQIQQFAQRIVGQQSQAQLIPLRQQAAQLQNQQMTAQNRYAGYSATDQSILGGLQADQNASALTNENAQAQAAQNTANQIDASGRAAAALNGGYTGPQAAAAQASTSQFQGGVQGAQAGYQVAQAGNNASLMSSLRQTAALQAQEGQMNIQSAYGKPIATNVAAQQAVIAKAPASTAAEAQSLGQTAFQDRILAQEYNLKNFTAKSAASLAATKQANDYTLGLQKNAVAAQQAQTAGYKAQTQRTYDTAQTATKQALAGNTIAVSQGALDVRKTLAQNTIRHSQAQDRIASINSQLRAGGLSEKTRHDLVTERQNQQKIAAASAPGSASTKTSAKYAGLIGGAANLYKQSTTAPGINPATGKPNKLTPGQAAAHVNVRLQSYGPAAAAAISLASKGYVTPDIVAQLKAIDVTLPAYMTKAPPGPQTTPGFNIASSPFTPAGTLKGP